jgi:pimeloyl-ACP methyl ester carboxylesterase
MRGPIGFVLLLTGCQAAPSPTVEAPASHSERRAGLVDIGGQHLFLDCAGEGKPTVVFESGGGVDGSAWHKVVPQLRHATSACVYDRVGTGRSSPATKPHTMQQMVKELDLLLEHAAVAPPYVLVGHSLGGLLVRLYASEQPGEVRGMVLVDPTTEEQDARMWSLLPPHLLREFKQALSRSPEGLDYDSFVGGMAQLRAANRALGDMPLIVLTAVGTQDPNVPPDLGEQIAREWLTMHEEVSRLSSNSAHVLVRVSHNVQDEAPGVVVAAVQEVLASAGTGQPVRSEHVRSAAGAR